MSPRPPDAARLEALPPGAYGNAHNVLVKMLQVVAQRTRPQCVALLVDSEK
jgi:hypothetical protein